MSFTLANLTTDRINYVLTSLIGRAMHYALPGYPKQALMYLIIYRLHRIRNRLLRVAILWREGRLTPAKPRKSRAGKARAARKLSELPTKKFWLRHLLVQTQFDICPLEMLVDDPEMRAIIAAGPQAGRLLRPLHHMLGLPLPPHLRLQSRPRKLRPAKAKPAPDPALPPPLPFERREAAPPEPSATPPLRWRGYEIPKGMPKPPGYPKRRLLPFESSG
jgi:hypothetical protein